MVFKDFQWMNKTGFEETENGVAIYAPGKTDYFVNPVDGDVKANAPFYYKEVDGDFILKAKVSLDFESIYDAGVLLAFDYEKLWAKRALNTLILEQKPSLQ